MSSFLKADKLIDVGTDHPWLTVPEKKREYDFLYHVKAAPHTTYEILLPKHRN